MTELEQQVADALQRQLLASPLEMFDELNERDIQPLAEYLAPRVAAAIRQAIDEVGDRGAEEILGDEGHRDAILAALRGGA